MSKIWSKGLRAVSVICFVLLLVYMERYLVLLTRWCLMEKNTDLDIWHAPTILAATDGLGKCPNLLLFIDKEISIRIYIFIELKIYCVLNVLS